jgi:hypothetical protein
MKKIGIVAILFVIVAAVMVSGCISNDTNTSSKVNYSSPTPVQTGWAVDDCPVCHLKGTYALTDDEGNVLYECSSCNLAFMDYGDGTQGYCYWNDYYAAGGHVTKSNFHLVNRT